VLIISLDFFVWCETSVCVLSHVFIMAMKPLTTWNSCVDRSAA
jgi:hypothetical protein